jgi:hypothetical protein
MGIEQIFGFLFTSIGNEGDSHYIDSPIGLDNWFKHDKEIPIINVSFKVNIDETKKMKTFIDKINSNNLSNENELFYHTTTWNWAFHVMEKINHSHGRKCLDFGLLPGFYMGTRIKDTLEWGERIFYSRGSKGEVATVIFSIPKKKPNNIRYKELVGDEWKYVVKMSRKCQAPPFHDELPEVDGIDLIYGYMLRNSETVKHGSPPMKYEDNKKQLVSKTDKGDQYLQTKILGVIFYSKY